MAHKELHLPDRTRVSRLRTGAFRVFLASAVITAFAGNAVVIDGARLSLSNNAAFAKGGGGGGAGGGAGGGHGGGGGGGHGGGHGAAHGNAPKGGLGTGHGRGHGVGEGHAKGRGSGHANGRHGDDGDSAPSGHRAPVVDKSFHASALGSLNAAHASPTAFANAAPNSKVGQIAAFARAVENDQVEEAAQALAAAANKAITEDMVTDVARLADVEVSEQTAQDIAERAAAIQSGGN